jgi:hypothetical protein
MGEVAAVGGVKGEVIRGEGLTSDRDMRTKLRGGGRMQEVLVCRYEDEFKAIR